MNNMWGAGLRTTSAMLLLICARHNNRMLSGRCPCHVMDYHLNPTLSSHIEKVMITQCLCLKLKAYSARFIYPHVWFSPHVLEYEEIAFPLQRSTRSNVNVLDFKWVPLLQMLAPTNQDEYNEVLVIINTKWSVC